MCIPCWPRADIWIEEPPKKKKKDEGILMWDPNAGCVVKVVGSQVTPVSMPGLSLAFFFAMYVLFTLSSDGVVIPLWGTALF